MARQVRHTFNRHNGLKPSQIARLATVDVTSLSEALRCHDMCSIYLCDFVAAALMATAEAADSSPRVPTAVEEDGVKTTVAVVTKRIAGTSSMALASERGSSARSFVLFAGRPP